MFPRILAVVIMPLPKNLAKELRIVRLSRSKLCSVDLAAGIDIKSFHDFIWVSQYYINEDLYNSARFGFLQMQLKLMPTSRVQCS